MSAAGLRAVGIYNPYSAVGKASAAGATRDIFINYRPQESGRLYRSAAWQVVRPGHRTGPEGAWWGDNGHKTFDVSSRDEREAQLAAAKAWASEHYGVTEWVKIPGLPGAWFPRGVADFVKALAKDGAK